MAFEDTVIASIACACEAISSAVSNITPLGAAVKMLLDGLLYEAASHWFSGHPKHGKTILVMHAAIELIERGHHVIWLDYEGGARRTIKRAFQLPQ